MKSVRHEGELYEPVRYYLQKQFAQFGECEFEITARKIPEKVKKWLDDPALFIREKIFPDMMGYFIPNRSKIPPNGFHRGLIITEVKIEQPRIRDIIQTKVYAEAFGASFAYLISSEDMIEEIRRFLRQRRSILSYYAHEYPRNLYIGWFRHKALRCVWHPENPFKRF